MENNKYTCHHCQHQICARRVPIFSTLDPDQLNQVVRLIIRKEYKKGELLFMECSPLESLMIINEGQVKAFKNTPQGKEQILYIFTEGDFFGEKNLLHQQKATFHVEALEETKICVIHKNDFQKLLREFPDIAFKIIAELSQRMERLENTIEIMGTRSVETRINMLLLEFSRKYGVKQNKGIMVELPFSREGIANYLGLARETVSRNLSRLRDEGVIEMVGNKKIIILRIDDLKE